MTTTGDTSSALIASTRDVSKCTTQPSARPYPSALESRVLQRPSAASMDAPDSTQEVSRRIRRLIPHASAYSDPLAIELVTETCTPIRDDEHAVSMLLAGPFRSNV